MDPVRTPNPDWGGGSAGVLRAARFQLKHPHIPHTSVTVTSHEVTSRGRGGAGRRSCRGAGTLGCSTEHLELWLEGRKSPTVGS